MQYSVHTCTVGTTGLYTRDYSEQLWFPLNEIDQPQLLRENQGKPQLQNMYTFINPRRAGGRRDRVHYSSRSVSVFVCLSATILALHATRRLMIDTNSFSATRAR